MDQADRDAADEAWEEADVVLEADDRSARALAVLERAARLNAGPDDESRARRVELLQGIALCHLTVGDGSAARRIGEELLTGDWPVRQLYGRLHGVNIVCSWDLLPAEQVADLAARAIALAGGDLDDRCRAKVAALLRLRVAAELEIGEIAKAIELQERLVAGFGDVNPDDEAVAWLAYLRGRNAINLPGHMAEAEASFRAAAEAGYVPAWLELAIVLSWQRGREDEEIEALQHVLADDDFSERRAHAGIHLGRLLLHSRGDRDGARVAFGQAVMGRGATVPAAVMELAVIAALDGDEEARRHLVNELTGRVLEEDDPEARSKDYPQIAEWSRLTYHPRFFPLRTRAWQRRRARIQREVAKTGMRPS